MAGESPTPLLMNQGSTLLIKKECDRVLYVGKEATESFEDVGHSPDARDQQKKYLIGEIAEPKSKKTEVCF